MRRWQLFLGIEFALILWLGFQIITNPMALTTILFGVLFLFLGARWHRMRAFNVTFGGILLVLPLVSRLFCALQEYVLPLPWEVPLPSRL